MGRRVHYLQYKARKQRRRKCEGTSVGTQNYESMYSVPGPPSPLVYQPAAAAAAAAAGGNREGKQREAEM